MWMGRHSAASVVVDPIAEVEKATPMKPTEVHKMSLEELRIEAQRLRRHLFDLRSQAVTEKLENPKQMVNTRRDIARVLTETRQREIQESV